MSSRIKCLLLVFLLYLPDPSLAGIEVDVTVKGVGESLHENVLARLRIYLQKDSERLQASTIRKLHRQAQDDIRSAIAPFGYYNPVIKSSLGKKGSVWIAEYKIEKGPPVVVKRVSLEVSGPGRENNRLVASLSQFPTQEGAVLNQNEYERGKKKLIHLAHGEGFLDASFSEHTIRIHRQTNSASVHLVLETGVQYLFGETNSMQEILNQDLLDRFLPYEAGEPYNPAKLFELQSILYRTDYFRRVEVRAQTDKVKDRSIPVRIELTAPEHLNKYNLGIGYATDTGVGGKIDWSNRLLNSKGHQASALFQLAQRENTVSLRYDIPQGNPRYDKLIYGLSYEDKEWDVTNTRLLTAAVTREHSSPRLKFSVGLELRDEVYDVGSTSGESTLLVPSLNGGVIMADDILNTTKGLQASVEVLGAVEGIGSDAGFLQTTVSGKAIVTPFDNWRLIGRGAFGATLVDSIDSIPPSLRFYTGGDTSIRGYKYRSIGPVDDSGAVVGGRFLVVGSIEVERIIAKQWSVAAFWDGGSATDDLSLDFYQGVGTGVRFRLPFVQIRLDLAWAITEDDNPLRVHLTVGGDW